MKAEINQKDLDSNELSWLSVKPMLISVRGQDMVAKREVYLQLNEGQQALYLFYAYHNHTKSLAEFYWFSAYHIIELRSWSGIRKGMQFFDLHEMVDVLNDIEVLITDAKKSGGTWQDVSPTDLDHDLQLRQQTERIYDSYQLAAQKAIIAMNDWVRQHQEMFLEIKEDLK
ncbi:hypothetical protein ACN9MH_08055 [Paenibacillus silvae]|jgi:hypothetical protein|uniref:hypothetical protein n=1 Tax=Paenibacillus TaxID=44249 RepID=UPI001C110553|nr:MULTISPECIES: hypothetical protein [Paenibacillus]MBU5356277.1 hypothetical protein [Paenibacillus barcinonensis]MDM5279066.1 hypothetical protein [Paenibacillus silvae]